PRLKQHLSGDGIMNIEIAVPVADDDQAATGRQRRGVWGRSSAVPPPHLAGLPMHPQQLADAIRALRVHQVLPPYASRSSAAFDALDVAAEGPALAVQVEGNVQGLRCAWEGRR